MVVTRRGGHGSATGNSNARVAHGIGAHVAAPAPEWIARSQPPLWTLPHCDVLVIAPGSTVWRGPCASF